MTLIFSDHIACFGVARPCLLAHASKAGPEETFRTYRRHLPHLRSRERLYFVTWRIHRSQHDLTPEERDMVSMVLRHFDPRRYDLQSFVVMNDHVHVLVSPEENERLEDILHSWKSYSAHILQRKFGRRGSVWQNEYFDRIVRNEQELYEKMIYILNNPNKRWPEDQKYRWVWCKGLE
jgi:REP element-mobilizing transposase RayT